MPLPPGHRFGPYEIVAAIGSGGMGDVYRARDTKLGRDVAIKTLPPTFAADPDRLARFEREAHLLASLNHPHIAAIYGVEQVGDSPALILELADGETLADRLRRGPMPVEEALELARQIAEALESAHEKGIIHRDLKPANIKITPAGDIKVLDFGLAKALVDESTAPDASISPTLTAVGTRAGVILGTAAYMSPEQARAGRADRRSDVWAFGCVLYEMLTGQQAFKGDSISDILASVLRAEPELGALPADTPDAIRRLLQRMLRKDAKRRLHDIADARLEIDEALHEPATPEAPARSQPAARWTRAVPWTLLVLVTLAAAWLLWDRGRVPPAITVPSRVSIVLPPGVTLAAGESGAALALSPDGAALAFVGRKDKETDYLYVQSIRTGETRTIPGTEGAQGPTFSPDGHSLAFALGMHVFRVPVAGGATVRLTRRFPAFAPRWVTADWIFGGGPNTGITRVWADARPDEMVTTPDARKKEASHYFPVLVPGGHALLYTAEIEGKTMDDGQIAAYRFDSGAAHVIVEGGSDAHIVSDDLLVYANRGRLMGLRFDPAALTSSGSAIVLQDGVMMSTTSGNGEFDIADDGTLAYVAGPVVGPMNQLVWVTRTGAVSPLGIQPGPYLLPRLAPDGGRVVFETRGPNDDIWMWDPERGTRQRLTFDAENLSPVWSADGKAVILAHHFSGQENPTLSRLEADGTGTIADLSGEKIAGFPTSLSPDGGTLAYTASTPDTRGDIWLLDTKAGSKPRAFIRTPADEHHAMFSPNGRWLAYNSDETGREEVYVRPVTGGGQTLVSVDGGTQPRWARSGRELFYRSGERMMSVEIRPGADFSAGKPRVLFEAPFEFGEFAPNYDVSPDGSRFLMIKKEKAQAAPTRVELVLNWVDEVRRRMAR